MRTPLLTAIALSLAFTLPAASLDIETMSDAERAAFRAEVRAYLMDNPEVLMEAIGVLEQRQQSDAVQNDLALLKANADALYNDSESWSGGNPEGDITIVEFMDYR
ncbi:MAG: DsbA family protein, partial [Paracoccaceae bacterium]|nr:DsbA family protein [Paracoccaceae bacterium]